MTEKTQQGIKSKKSTPMGRVSPVTPATLGPAEGMVSPTDENVVKHQLRESPTQSASGLPAPTRDEPSDPSSEDDQRSPKLKGVSLPGESVKSKDDALAEVDQVPGSSAYPTAPSSPRDSDLVKNLEELELNGNSETQDGPALNERPGSPDSSVTSSRPSLDEADTPSSPALAVDGHTVPHGETEEVVTEEEEHPVLPVTAIVPAPQADELTVLALDVASEEPRNAESEQSTESEQSGDEDDQGHDPAVQASESEDDEDEDQRAVLPALADAGHDLAEPLEGRHSQPTGIRRAPRSYFYSTTATYEDISRNPARDTHYCIANKPNSEQCRNRRTDPHADICPAHSLFLRGHLFRRELPQFHEHVDYEDLVYHAANQEDFVIASTPEFEAFTDDFHPLIKQNIYFLIRDYLLVLGWKVDREDILEESSSALARKYRKDDDDLTSRIGCERVGRVYMLVPSPRPIDRDRMWFAGDRGTKISGKRYVRFKCPG
ncbi:unnamed protein product [Mortierella alpina]